MALSVDAATIDQKFLWLVLGIEVESTDLLSSAAAIVALVVLGSS